MNQHLFLKVVTSYLEFSSKRKDVKYLHQEGKINGDQQNEIWTQIAINAQKTQQIDWKDKRKFTKTNRVSYS